jgi:hypothetical protein
VSRGVIRGFGGLVGVRDWPLLFAGSCHVRGEPLGQVKDRAGPGRRGGAGGVLEVTRREPDDLAAGNGSRGRCGVFGCFRSVPWAGSSGAGSAAGCSHPFACPRPGPGGMGRCASDEAVRRGQSRRRPRRRSVAAGQTNRRPRAWPLARGKLFMPPAWPGSWAVSRRGSWTGSGSARRGCRRRPG